MAEGLKKNNGNNITESIDGDELLFVSVVMPVRNEEKYIEQSLGAVLNQEYPHDKMEVLVADGMSTDNTRGEVARLASSTDIPVNILGNPAKIVPVGMNIAIRKAKGDVVVRIDGHTIIESDYIKQCVASLKRSGAANVGGRMRAKGNNYLTTGIAIATSTPFGIGNSAFHYSDREQFVDTVYMGAFWRDTLFKVGLYNENFKRHQDYELNYRIRKNGGRILLTPSIRSHYYVRDSLKKLCEQYFQYGVWKGRFIRVYPDSIKIRHIIPPVFIFLLFFSFILSLFAKSLYLNFGFILGAYIFFLLTGSCLMSAKGKTKFVPLLPVILACIHFSWGIGVWIGLLSTKRYISQLKSGANVKL